MSDEWKVGDLVAFRGGMPERCHIRLVERITPSGLLCLNGSAGTKLRVKGDHLSEVGEGRSWGRGYWTRATPEIRQQAARERSIDRLAATNWKTLPDETLTEIIRILTAADAR